MGPREPMNFDVAVVGAGPSGAWAAYTLAKRGARVAVLDASHPREKPCGGGVTARALALVGGVIDVDRLPACVIRSARFTRPAVERSAVVPLGNRHLVVASRADFDSQLLAAARNAGADFVPSRVTGIAATPNGFRLETTRSSLSATCVVGADGANSLVRRRLAQPFGRAALSIATGYFVHGATSDEIVIEVIADPPGYIWSFPRPTHLAVGICAQADAGLTASALRARAAAWIRSIGLANGARLEAYSWPIPSLTRTDLRALRVAGPGWLLSGDAAGLVDPITREGIYFALLSGEWAADALSSGAGNPSRRYTERVHEEIVAELARAARLKAGFFRPRFTQLMIDALHDSAAVRTVMADLVAGRQGYAGLKWRLAKTLEARLAWRVWRGKSSRDMSSRG